METAQDNTVAIVAILVSGGVALLTAIVTPITAHYRQKGALRDAGERLDRQLEAEHDRLRIQLDAERDRLRVQHTAERELADLAELRVLLDEGATVIHSILDQLGNVWNEVRDSPDAMGKIRAEIEKTWDAIWPTYRIYERLNVRLGLGNPLGEAVMEVKSAVAATLSELGGWERVPSSDEQVAARSRHAAAVRPHRETYVSEAQRLVGSRVSGAPPEGPPPES